MRSLEVGLMVSVTLACTMENPAFVADAGGQDGGSGEETPETGEGESGSGEGGTGTTGQNDTTDGESTDSTDTDPNTSSSEGPNVCDYGRTEPLEIALGKDQLNGQCSGAVAGHFKVVGQVANGLSIEPCTSDGCLECNEAAARTLTIAPLEAPPLEACLWVVTELLVLDEPSACYYAGLAVWDESEGGETPRIVASTADYGPPGASLNGTGGFSPQFKPQFTCECADVVDVPDCCESEPPIAAKLDVDGMGVPPGGETFVHLGADAKQFTFHNVQSYRAGKCGSEKQVGWALLR